MNNPGLLTTSIVLANNELNFNMIMSELEPFYVFREGIFENPLYYDLRKKLRSIDEINFLKQQSYSIEYRMQKNNLFTFFNKDYVIIEHSKYLSVPLFANLSTLLSKFIKSSDVVLIGFETNLLIDEYPKDLDSVLIDRSLYPLYIHKKKISPATISFSKYSIGDPVNEFELIIENFLGELFNNSNLIFVKA